MSVLKPISHYHTRRNCIFTADNFIIAQRLSRRGNPLEGVALNATPGSCGASCGAKGYFLQSFWSDHWPAPGGMLILLIIRSQVGIFERVWANGAEHNPTLVQRLESAAWGCSQRRGVLGRGCKPSISASVHKLVSAQKGVTPSQLFSFTPCTQGAPGRGLSSYEQSTSLRISFNRRWSMRKS